MTTIVWIGFYNIGDNQFCAALLDDGSVQQIPITAPFTPVTQILLPGTIQNAASAIPSSSPPVSGNTILGFAQFGSSYALFAKDQPNGYWIWDGTNTYTAGTLSPTVTLTAPGKNYVVPPTVNFVSTASFGPNPGYVAPTFTAAVAPGTDFVEQVVVNTPGAGLLETDFSAAYITGGGTDDQAIGRVSVGYDLITGRPLGGVGECVVIASGSGMTFAAQAVFLATTAGDPTYHPGGPNGTYTADPGAATAVVNIINGGVTGIQVTFTGVGYHTAPILIINDPGYGSGSSHVSGGTGFSGQCNLEFGQCTGIQHIDGSPWDHSLGQFGPAEGTNYLTPPTVKIIGDGTGAQAVAVIDGTDGSISHFIMKNFGSGYTKGWALVEGGNNSANVEVAQMPFGISGTAIEIYQSRVWIANGAAAGDEYSTPPLPPKGRVIFSVSGDPANFDPTQGAGAFRGNNSFLRVGYHAMKQVNGFLYLLGDASLDYISGVVTQSQTIPGTNVPGVPTTTFNLQNSDPAVGTAWPSSALIVNRKLIFANPIGVYEAPGGAARKISLPLDGFYGVVPKLNGTAANYPAAAATIFGLPVYMLLIPFTDLYTGNRVNKLVLWTGENWFTSAQSKNLTFIASQEINSILTAWGTDGQSIFPLFQTPSTLFQKVVQSKLYSAPAYLADKATNSLHAIIKQNIQDGEPVTIEIDSENSTSAPAVLVMPPTVGATPSLGPVYGPMTVGQHGRLIGFTLFTNASDLELNSLGLVERVESPNV